ncbi:MAG TPA: hypothetical protein VJB87_00625 [Candidatus Nanoarchaeia archaeon]|nr:hypothetical protein [Candidatus Nanoarchaeia archaeon]
MQRGNSKKHSQLVGPEGIQPPVGVSYDSMLDILDVFRRYEEKGVLSSRTLYQGLRENPSLANVSENALEKKLDRAVPTLRFLGIPFLRPGDGMNYLGISLHLAATLVDIAYGRKTEATQAYITQQLSEATPEKPLHLKLLNKHYPVTVGREQRRTLGIVNQQLLQALFGDKQFWDRNDLSYAMNDGAPRRFGLLDHLERYHPGLTHHQRVEQFFMYAAQPTNKPETTEDDDEPSDPITLLRYALDLPQPKRKTTRHEEGLLHEIRKLRALTDRRNPYEDVPTPSEKLEALA